MTHEQEVHLKDIKSWITESIDIKYRKGQEEHGGNLWDRDTTADLSFEIVDAVTYFYCVLRKMRQLEGQLRALATENRTLLNRVRELEGGKCDGH